MNNYWLWQQLQQHPEQFEGIQVLRLLEFFAGPVRFCAVPNLAFPQSDVARISITQPHINVELAFFGLTGPSGVLPDHYTVQLLQSLQQKNTALQDFLTIFQHHLVTLFYAAWKKTHACLTPASLFTHILLSLTGLGTPHLTQRTAIPDTFFCYFAGHFADQRRSLSGLMTVAKHYLQIPIKIFACHWKWVYLPKTARSFLGRRCQLNALGENALLGKRHRYAQLHFKIIIYPSTLAQFQSLLPAQLHLQNLVTLVRHFVGPEYSFAIQLCLAKEVIPRCVLSLNGATALGWQTWLIAYNNVGVREYPIFYNFFI